jgi:hypothetical protein
MRCQIRLAVQDPSTAVSDRMRLDDPVWADAPVQITLRDPLRGAAARKVQSYSTSLEHVTCLARPTGTEEVGSHAEALMTL